jgi:hypothetical protein
MLLIARLVHFSSSEIASSFPGDYVLRCLKQEVEEILSELKLCEAAGNLHFALSALPFMSTKFNTTRKKTHSYHRLTY